MYVIEHLEPRLYKWCLIEYSHISHIVGKENLMFTNASSEKLKKLGKVCRKRAAQVGLSKACVLDPFAGRQLTSKDRFDYYIFGGILGDEPMQGRTGKELVMDCARRNIGREQMSTDNAAYVAKHIINGGSLSGLDFQDDVEIPVRKGESVILPFRYVVVEGKPLLAPGLVEHLKRSMGF
jgi:ribosome biogenesis SPOUT family RNA methylase Rps3